MIRISFGSALRFATCVALGGCHLFDADRQEFIVQIDSIVGPTTVGADTASVQRLFGPIGPDGCYRFKTVRLERTANNADLTVFGEHIDGAGDCTAMPVYLSGHPVTLTPPVSDPFTIRVHQRDGTVLGKVLRAP